LFALLYGGRMKNGKKKSSGWRPSGKRRTPAEHQARHFARRAATAQGDSDRLGRWRSCPVRRCRRLGRCDSELLQCERRPRPAAAIQASLAAEPPDAFNRDDLEALIREGRV
jgi:hypothetical protein